MQTGHVFKLYYICSRFSTLTDFRDTTSCRSVISEITHHGKRSDFAGIARNFPTFESNSLMMENDSEFEQSYESDDSQYHLMPGYKIKVE